MSSDINEIVIAIYRPFEKAFTNQMLELIKSHNTTLRVEGLITDRPAILAQSADNSLLEIFEWVPGGAEKAHNHPAIKKLWRKMEKLADFAPLISLPESEGRFPHFKPIDGYLS
ncbi:hypothetical protein OAU50_03800 [Planctomycetota bacterium]|nr:hypothetical protein [Planctomycetota bacterium]